MCLSSQLCLRLRSGGLQFQVSLAKKFVELHLNRKKLGVVVHAYHPSHGGTHKIRV
jgi:hypothetical protein